MRIKVSDFWSIGLVKNLKVHYMGKCPKYALYVVNTEGIANDDIENAPYRWLGYSLLVIGLTSGAGIALLRKKEIRWHKYNKCEFYSCCCFLHMSAIGL